MIELTLEQRQIIGQKGESPLCAVNPDTDTTYVLIPEEVYARLRGLFEEEEFLDDMYLPVMKVFGQEGWDDPAMDIYNPHSAPKGRKK